MYAGDISCRMAWASLKDETAALVDVRTSREWEMVGVPDLKETGKDVIFAEFLRFPDMSVNMNFTETVDAALKAQGVSKNDPVFFLCRSGARSQGAASAMTALGYTKAYNIISGFEGDPDGSGGRGNLNGWQFDGLPWRRE